MKKLLQVYGCKITAINMTILWHKDQNMDVFKDLKKSSY